MFSHQVELCTDYSQTTNRGVRRNGYISAKVGWPPDAISSFSSFPEGPWIPQSPRKKRTKNNNNNRQNNKNYGLGQFNDGVHVFQTKSKAES